MMYIGRKCFSLLKIPTFRAIFLDRLKAIDLKISPFEMWRYGRMLRISWTSNMDCENQNSFFLPK